MMCLNMLALGLRGISISCLVAFSMDIGGEVNKWGYSKHCTQRDCFAVDERYSETGKNRCWEKDKWCRDNLAHGSETCVEYEDIWAPFDTGVDTMAEHFDGFVVEETCLQEARNQRQEVIGVVRIIVYVAIVMTISIGMCESTIVTRSWRLLRDTSTAVTTAAIDYVGPDGEPNLVRFASVTPQPVHEARVEVVGPATEANETGEVGGNAAQQRPSRASSTGFASFFAKPGRQSSRERSSSLESGDGVELTAAVPTQVTVAVPTYLPQHDLLPAAVEAYERPAASSRRSRSGSDDGGGGGGRGGRRSATRAPAFPAQNAPSLDGL